MLTVKCGCARSEIIFGLEWSVQSKKWAEDTMHEEGVSWSQPVKTE